MQKKVGECMDLKAEEISKIIKSQIKDYGKRIEQSETGTVVLVGDGIAKASGLDKCMANELVEFENGEYGMALNLEEDFVSGRRGAGRRRRPRPGAAG